SEGQAIAHAAAELELEAMISGVAVRGDQIHIVRRPDSSSVQRGPGVEWIGLEKVDWIRAGTRVAAAGACRKRRSRQPAEIRRRTGKAGGQRARLALRELGDECAVAEARAVGQCRLARTGAESRFENRQRNLTRAAQIGKTGNAGLLVDV